MSAWAITERETIERARAAANAGAYGLCVKPPHYVHSWADAPTSAIVRRFEVVAKAVPLPMMVYNSPNRTNVRITPDVLEAICGVAQVEALKDTDHDAGHQLENVLRFHDRMAVLVSGPAFMPAMLMGARGTIGTGMDLFADADRMFDFVEMTPEERRALQRKMFDVSRVINTTGTIPAAYKAAFNMLGLPGGCLREPVAAADPRRRGGGARPFGALRRPRRRAAQPRQNDRVNRTKMVNSSNRPNSMPPDNSHLAESGRVW